MGSQAEWRFWVRGHSEQSDRPVRPRSVLPEALGAERNLPVTLTSARRSSQQECPVAALALTSVFALVRVLGALTLFGMSSLSVAWVCLVADCHLVRSAWLEFRRVRRLGGSVRTEAARVRRGALVVRCLEPRCCQHRRVRCRVDRQRTIWGSPSAERRIVRVDGSRSARRRPLAAGPVFVHKATSTGQM